MKKIGIITINDNNNYGNRLQNYATQEFLKKLSTELEICTVKNNAVTNKQANKIESLLRNMKSYKLRFCEMLKRDRNRYNCFKNFNKNIVFSKRTFSWLKKEKFEYFDFCISGSDQVWNPYYRLSEFDLLKFIEKKKRIAFSASMATNLIPVEKLEYAKNSFEDFKAISVREDSGKKIIEDLTKRDDIDVLVDPTMLLSSEEWDKVLKKPVQLNYDRYILNYFLGEIPDEWKNEINRISKENNCKVINILDKKDPFYKTGPSEFLYLEKNAFLICTDSFHSSVFSIIYDTPFIIFNRIQKNVVSMNSRIDTLLSKFELQDRRFNGTISKDLLKCDYKEAKKILEKEKEKSFTFLKNALDIE